MCIIVDMSEEATELDERKTGRPARRTPRGQVEQLYTAREIAGLLKIGYSTVWRLVALGRKTKGTDGIFPCYKISHKTVRIPASAITRFLEGRQR